MEPTSTGPLIPRRRLGATLRDLREGRSETLQQTARALMFSPSKLSRIENGLAGEPHPRDVRDLIAHFDLEDSAQAVGLQDLAEQSRQPGWWQVPPYDMPTRLDTFISYESSASRIEAYVPTVVPGLLQIRPYAAEAIGRLVPHLTPPEVGHQTEIRMRRQQEHLRRSDRASALYVVPETVLRRHAGSVTTMRQQLTALVETYDDPLIDLHVIPYSSGVYEAVELSTMTIFEFADVADSDVVAIERVRFVQFMDKPETVQKYRDVIHRLSKYWLNRADSRKFIDDVRSRT